jgi:hypothetical protein
MKWVSGLVKFFLATSTRKKFVEMPGCLMFGRDIIIYYKFEYMNLIGTSPHVPIKFIYSEKATKVTSKLSGISFFSNFCGLLWP